MSDERPIEPDLTDAEIAELADDLAAREIELRAELERDSDTADIVDLDTPQGRLSRMDAMQQQKMAQAQRARLRVRLSRLAQAKVALRDEEYGECRLCGESIGYRRLKVRPEAPLCLVCTEAAERRR